jgi:hypothetical protein
MSGRVRDDDVVIRSLSQRESAALRVLLSCDFVAAEALRRQAESATASGDGLIIDLIDCRSVASRGCGHLASAVIVTGTSTNQGSPPDAATHSVRSRLCAEPSSRPPRSPTTALPGSVSALDPSNWPCTCDTAADPADAKAAPFRSTQQCRPEHITAAECGCRGLLSIPIRQLTPGALK